MSLRRKQGGGVYAFDASREGGVCISDASREVVYVSISVT